MPYARFDDRYDDHKKIKRAWRRQPAAVGLHAMAITYCNRHTTDGLIDSDWVDEKLALLPVRTSQRRDIVSLLLDLKLFEQVDEETFLVHDFLDWNLSAAQRRALAEQGKKGGQAKANGSSPPPSKGSSQGLSNGHSGGSSTPSPTPTPRHAEEKQLASLRSDVQDCFAYWQQRCRHPTAKLTADRRRKIEARRREGYTVAQIYEGIDGAARGAFVDDTGTKFDDIELICRTGSKLESFIGRKAAKPAGEMSELDRKRLASMNKLKNERGVA